MPLSTAVAGLQLDIQKAFDDKRKAMEENKEAFVAAQRDAINAKFYAALAQAIHKYVLQAQVMTSGGGPVTGIAAPVPTPAGSAAVIAAATVTTSGNLV
tara:strand:- start:3444 stop:3740 length:297 start_codon:yes stop_codon:yes gene_type:complete